MKSTTTTRERDDLPNLPDLPWEVMEKEDVGIPRGQKRNIWNRYPTNAKPPENKVKTHIMESIKSVQNISQINSLFAIVERTTE